MTAKYDGEHRGCSSDSIGPCKSLVKLCGSGLFCVVL
jgi:hypothetical protein